MCVCVCVSNVYLVHIFTQNMQHIWYSDGYNIFNFVPIAVPYMLHVLCENIYQINV